MLTDAQCRTAKAGESDYKMTDALGLHLYVTKAGYKSWRLSYSFHSKKKRIVFGPYPAISLREARDMRDEARRLLARGIDPAIDRHQKKAAALAASDTTVELVARAWYHDRASMWSKSHSDRTLNMLEREVFKSIGNLPIAAVTRPMVVRQVKEIEKRGALEMARRYRTTLSSVFEYARGMGYATENPAGDVIPVKSAPVKRYPALTEIEQLRSMLWKIENASGHPIAKLASRLTALTAVRPGVVQAAPWEELKNLDPAEPTWIIPPARMKLTVQEKLHSQMEHPVPLARQAVELLDSLQLLTGHSAFAFASPNSPEKHISDASVSKLYRQAGFTDVHVPHGWRSAFSTIMNELAMKEERPGDRVVIDIMLAHRQPGIEPIYNRSAYMKRRREIAQEWADLLLKGFPPVSSILMSRRSE
ncbi:MAG: integrase [Tistrella sp.]|nr:integrase [Tistrella sp.]|tara:strand:- start:1318 stop:2574 length:1257 start_codon:yes stop_codon:yes gene_type:complete